MNLGVTIARSRTDGKWVVVVDPNTPVSVQRRQFRSLASGTAELYDEVRVITTAQGQIKKRKLRMVDLKSAGVINTPPTPQDEDDQEDNEPEAEPTSPAPVEPSNNEDKDLL